MPVMLLYIVGTEAEKRDINSVFLRDRSAASSGEQTQLHLYYDKATFRK